MSLVGLRMPAISQLRQLLLVDPQLFRTCTALVASAVSHATFSVFDFKFIQPFSPDLMSYIQLHGFDVISARLANHHYASVGDLAQETYAFFDGLNGYYMPGSLRILVESAREHFDKLVQKTFPFIRSAFQTSESSTSERRSSVPAPSNKQEREWQPQHPPALPASSSGVPSSQPEPSAKRRRREERTVRENELDLSKWAALCEVVWFENLGLMSQRATKRIEMASDPFSGNQLMFDAIRYMHRVNHRLDSLRRRRKHSVPFSDGVQQDASNAHASNAAPAATAATAPQDNSEGESVRGSEFPVRKEDLAEGGDTSAATDGSAAEYRGHKAVHRFQLFYQLTLEAVLQYEIARKELANRFSTASLAELDERIQARKSKLDGFKALPRALTNRTVDEVVVDYIELVQVLVLNQILQLEMVSEDVRRLFQDLQQLHKQCRVELADLEVAQHRAFFSVYQSAAETLILLFIDNRCSRLLTEAEQQKILSRTHQALSRSMDAMMTDATDKTECVVGEQLTFADIGFRYLEFAPT